MTSMPRSLAAAALAALLASPQPLLAQSSPRSVVAAPLQDLQPANPLVDHAERLWGDLLGWVGLGTTSGHFARQHGALQRNAIQQQQDDFTWLMDIAGYKLKEIESSVGLIPSFGLTFGQARELTEADRDYIERMLDRHARRNPGPLATIQRTIVRGILDTAELGGFSVDKVEVAFFPLPKVKFVLSPTDAPLGIEASRIMRAIERLNTRVQGMAPRPSGQGTDLPMTGREPQLRPVSLDH